MSLIEVKCDYCDEIFTRYEREIGDKKYCSKKCYHLSTIKREYRNCLYCGTKFEIFPSEIRKGGGKFCSLKCYWKNRKEKGLFMKQNHHNWQGGKSYEPYCILFDDDFKERVRKFWDYKCGISGITEKENGCKLSVHHVSYDKDSCCEAKRFNSTPNLFIPLTRGWNSRVNFNRDYWEVYLSNYIMIWFDGECYVEKTKSTN
jgi:hypothetical protein